MKSFSLVVGLLAATACVPATACDEYVDYMCDCHPEEDCQTLRVIHQDAEGEMLSDCTIALDEQLEVDDSDGLDCDLGSEI